MLGGTNPTTSCFVRNNTYCFRNSTYVIYQECSQYVYYFAELPTSNMLETGTVSNTPLYQH
jgi:hypothetical protein